MSALEVSRRSLVADNFRAERLIRCKSLEVSSDMFYSYLLPYYKCFKNSFLIVVHFVFKSPGDDSDRLGLDSSARPRHPRKYHERDSLCSGRGRDGARQPERRRAKYGRRRKAEALACGSSSTNADRPRLAARNDPSPSHSAGRASCILGGAIINQQLEPSYIRRLRLYSIS